MSVRITIDVDEKTGQISGLDGITQPTLVSTSSNPTTTLPTNSPNSTDKRMDTIEKSLNSLSLSISELVNTVSKIQNPETLIREEVERVTKKIHKDIEEQLEEKFDVTERALSKLQKQQLELENNLENVSKVSSNATPNEEDIKKKDLDMTQMMMQMMQMQQNMQSMQPFQLPQQVQNQEMSQSLEQENSTKLSEVEKERNAPTKNVRKKIASMMDI